MKRKHIDPEKKYEETINKLKQCIENLNKRLEVMEEFHDRHKDGWRALAK